MEDQKQKIKEMERKKKKKHREIGAAIGLIILGGAITLGLTQTNILTDVGGSATEKIDYDKEVDISYSIRPYRTQINSTGVVRFNNNRESAINITFETNNIDENIYIKANQSGYFHASKYNDLPYRNYYNLESGDTGEIIIE